MKPFRFIPAALSLAAIFAISASAQTPAQQPAARPAGQSSTTIAVIDTGAFDDPQNGIRRVINAVNGVNRTFEPRRNELQQLQTRYDTLVRNLQSQQGVPADATALNRQRAEAEQLQVEITRKREDAQRDYERALSQALEPVYADVGRVLQEFAQSRGYGLVIDAGRAPGLLLLVNDGMNITSDFIAEYNRRNPAPAAAATPATTPATTPARPATNTAAPAGRRP